MKKVRRVLTIIPTAGLLVISLAACLPKPPPQVSPSPPVARPICVEESTDQTPNVFEFMWTYPNPAAVPVQKCQPKLNQWGHPMQIDVWISVGRNTAGVLSMLCSSIRGILRGPVNLASVWAVCMDVDRTKLGIPN